MLAPPLLSLPLSLVTPRLIQILAVYCSALGAVLVYVASTPVLPNLMNAVVVIIAMGNMASTESIVMILIRRVVSHRLRRQTRRKWLP